MKIFFSQIEVRLWIYAFSLVFAYEIGSIRPTIASHTKRYSRRMLMWQHIRPAGFPMQVNLQNSVGPIMQKAARPINSTKLDFN